MRVESRKEKFSTKRNLRSKLSPNRIFFERCVIIAYKCMEGERNAMHFYFCGSISIVALRVLLPEIPVSIS